MSWGPDAPKPDPSIGDAQEAMADLAKKQNEFYEQNIAPRVLDQLDMQSDISKRLAEQQMGLTEQYNQRYWDTTAKYQDKFFGLVDQYSAADEQERSASAARSDIAQSMASANQQTLRGMSRMGINPNSGAFQTAMRKSATDGALASAQASTMARQAAKELGMRYVGAASGMNEGLIGATQGAAGGAMSAGASGMSALGQASGMSQGQLSAQSSTYNNIGNLGLGVYNGQLNAYGQQLGMIGTLAGAGMGMAMSDRRFKKHIRALATRRDGLRVYEFEYVWGGGKQIGMMADEVAKVYPQAVIELGGIQMVDYSKVGG